MKPNAAAERQRKADDQSRYDAGQHRLICELLGVSSKSSLPGPTAYEAVCALVMKLNMAKKNLRLLDADAKVLAFLNKDVHDFEVIQVTFPGKEKP